MASETPRRVAILTSGGDAPGMTAVARAAVCDDMAGTDVTIGADTALHRVVATEVDLERAKAPRWRTTEPVVRLLGQAEPGTAA